LRKPLKIAAILVAVAIGLLALIAIALFVFVDPNRYRDDIVQAVKQQTGRDLKIEGELSLSLFPWIGLETDRLVLSNANAPGFGAEPFAVVESSETKVELLPLLRKRIVVDAVRLNGLKLNLARNAKGQTNWEDLAKQADQPASKPTPKTTPKEGAGAALAAFTINTFEVRNSEFTWRDDVAKTEYAVRGLDLTSGNVLGAQPASLKLGFNLESSSPPIRERVQLDSRLRFDAAKEVLDVPELRLTVGDLRVNAQLTASNVTSAPTVNGKLEIPTFDARALLQRFGVAYAPVDANALRQVALSTTVQHDPKASALSDLRVTLDDTELTGKLAIQNQPATAYRFDLALDGIDHDRYLQKASPDPERPDQGSGA
jgi:AsmA protein